MIFDGFHAGFAAANILLAATGVPGCPAPPAPDVRVYATTAATVVDESRPITQLKEFQIDSGTPYYAAHLDHADIGGVTHGVIGVEYGIRLGLQAADVPGRVCVHYHDITVVLTLTPTIYLARNLGRGGCLYNAVKNHEMEHVAIDRAAMESYAGIIRDGFDMVFAINGNRQSPPILPSDRDFMQARMEQTVVAQTGRVLDNLYADRIERQRALDTPQSYAALMRQCPGWMDEMAR